jgi:hypothetical protein
VEHRRTFRRQVKWRTGCEGRVSSQMRPAGVSSGRLWPAAAGGSALSQPGLTRPEGRSCARRFAGDWTADGMPCPLRREHLIIRLQVSPGAVSVCPAKH